jgi:hypothetical protein
VRLRNKRIGKYKDGKEGRILDRRHHDNDTKADGGNEVIANLLTSEQKYRLYNARYSNLYYDRRMHHNHAGVLLGL